MSKSVRYIKRWLWTGIFLICAMVIIGGITRLTGSGLSIVEWKLISGILPPLTDEQWQVAFNMYKQFPEYQKLNYGIGITHFKKIFFWEYTHRLLGRIIGVVFLLPFLFFYFKQWLSPTLKRRLLIIFSLGALQGAVGWYMVKSGLKDIPHVSHFRLAAHQSMALLLMGIIFWTVLSIEAKEKTTLRNRSLKMLIPYVCMFLLFLQIVLGAFVAGLKGGFSYINFPLMGHSFFPSAQVIASKPMLYNGVVLQFIHRWLAFLVLLSFVALIWLSRSLPVVHRYVKIIVMLGVIQLVLGITTLLLQVPLVLGVAHQFVAILLFMLLIKIIYTLSFPLNFLSDIKHETKL